MKVVFHQRLSFLEGHLPLKVGIIITLVEVNQAIIGLVVQTKKQKRTNEVNPRARYFRQPSLTNVSIVFNYICHESADLYRIVMKHHQSFSKVPSAQRGGPFLERMVVRWEARALKSLARAIWPLAAHQYHIAFSSCAVDHFLSFSLYKPFSYKKIRPKMTQKILRKFTWVKLLKNRH